MYVWLSSLAFALVLGVLCGSVFSDCFHLCWSIACAVWLVALVVGFALGMGGC